MADQDLKVIQMSGEQVASDLRCFEDDVLGLVALDVDQAYKVGIVLVPAPSDIFQGFLLAVALGFQEEVLPVVYKNSMAVFVLELLVGDGYEQIVVRFCAVMLSWWCWFSGFLWILIRQVFHEILLLGGGASDSWYDSRLTLLFAGLFLQVKSIKFIYFRIITLLVITVFAFVWSLRLVICGFLSIDLLWRLSIQWIPMGSFGR